ncbi:MAG: hypothetical protein CMN85_10595 [Spongiibacteraceae bacterium]|nr:hypothetical protein [Spongiibacteraceae bacterium]|tara:strand:+ start:16977 stop:17903 length:927 start_codon:yes stop_codon:yes gene_type:complete
MKNQMFDAQAALGFVLSQTSHIESQVYQTRYADIQYPGLIPVDTSAHPLAKSVTYFSSDKFGAANWINGNADDVPLVGGERSKFETPVYTAGIGYAYGWEEIQHAQMLGINLTADDAMAARRAYEEMVDRVALNGDTSKGFEGLLNHSSVPTVASTNGTWTSKTADQILQDINDGLSYVHITATNTVAMADTVLLPWSRFNLISTKRVGDTNETVLGFLKRNNIYTAATGQELTIRGLRGLDSLGGSGEPRMVVYRRSPDVLKLHIPMPHRFMPVHQAGPLRFEVPGVFRLGGLDIRLPKEVAYIEGV